MYSYEWDSTPKLVIYFNGEFMAELKGAKAVFAYNTLSLFDNDKELQQSLHKIAMAVRQCEIAQWN